MKSIKRTDTADIVRTELKKAFPSVKFSVTTKSYSGGSSMNIKWTDGPTEKQVDLHQVRAVIATSTERGRGRQVGSKNKVKSK